MCELVCQKDENKRKKYLLTNSQESYQHLISDAGQSIGLEMLVLVHSIEQHLTDVVLFCLFVPSLYRPNSINLSPAWPKKELSNNV